MAQAPSENPDKAPAADGPADVCLLLEGTYPYIQGGVSAWVDQIISRMPDIRFAIFFIGSQRKTTPKQFYTFPKNVVAFEEVYIFEALAPEQKERHKIPRFVSREMYRLLGDVYFSQAMLDRVVAFWETLDFLDKAQVELTFANLCQDFDSWQLMRKGYQVGADGDSFIDYFWSVRFMHMPIWTLLESRHRVPEAKVYHSVSTGYAGVIGAFAARRRGAPYFITEHGIYTKERIAEISQATWIHESESYYFDPHRGLSVLKKMWINLFTFLGQISYESAERIIALYEGNTRLQIEYGARPERLEIIPNGIDPSTYDETREQRKRRRREGSDERVIVGFMGRVVPIKDVKTLIRSAYNVCRRCPHAHFLIAGPTEEDEEYFEACQELVEQFGIGNQFEFIGRQKPVEFLASIDIMLLTSISEGLPLVILEAFSASIPVVSTDVGACREMIEGRTAPDQELGPAGVVTRIYSPEDTADGLIRLIQSPDLVDEMGEAGRERVERYYVESDIMDQYQRIYRDTTWSRYHGDVGARVPAPATRV